MRVCNVLLLRGLAIACIIVIACAFCGCQRRVQVEREPPEPVFIPPAPDKPRLQFLTSFSSSNRFGKEAKRSGLEEFILGPEEKQHHDIVKPYGMAMYDGKLYVCDVGRRLVEVLDFENNEFSYLTKDRRLTQPVSICVDNGIKYVTDGKTGGVFVFDRDDKLIAIWGRDSDIRPLGIVVRGDKCYVTDVVGRQVVVLDRRSGDEIMRMGKRITDAEQTEADESAQFRMISDLALDRKGNVYVTDKLLGQISKFDAAGKFVRSFGRLGNAINDFIRPKGLAIDRENRIWVVDAATQVCKIYDEQGRLLLYFGQPGNQRGKMNLPATVIIDYDHVELFEQYAVQGAQLEFLVFVTNQFGPHKISVFGFGSFPEQDRAIEEQTRLKLEPEAEPNSL